MALLLLVHSFVLLVCGFDPPGPVLSNTIQVIFGCLCVPAAHQASRRSGPLGRYFWRLMTLTFLLWLVAQLVSSYQNYTGILNDPFSDMLFVFSTVPLGVALFLDPDHEPQYFDRLHWLDFAQALLFWGVVYCYFAPSQGMSPGDALWKRSMVYDAVLTGSFLLRARLTNSEVVRSLFGRMFLFLLFAAAADSYSYSPGRVLQTGCGFDIVWSLLLAIPLVIAATWDRPDERPRGTLAPRDRNLVLQHLFPLLYPALIMIVAAGLARHSPTLTYFFSFTSFLCFSGRLLVTQRRLLLSERRLERAKLDAESANRAKSEFLANMSHEIRTPLNGVCGMTEMALGLASGTEQREYLSMAMDSARGLLRVINDILDLSKVEAGRVVLVAEPFRLRETVESSVAVLAVVARQKGLALEVHIDDEVPPVLEGDGARLRQVLINLIGNAVKFTDSGFVQLQVKLSAAAGEKCQLLFQVADSGIGIPPQKTESIFDAFTQVDSTARRRFGGTGLGLTICRRLVGLMGGSIWVESALGRGTTFSFTVQLNRAELPGAAAPEAEAVSVPQRPLRVLVAEDNVINQRLMQRLLERERHQVRMVVDGEQAVAAATSEDWDVILMDIQMPCVNGIEATRRIRHWETRTGHRRVLIIALTARAMESDRLECAAAGMDGHIAKPFELSALAAALRQAGN